MANLSDLMGFALTVTIRYTVNFGQFLGSKSPLKSETNEPTKLLSSSGMRGCKFKSAQEHASSNLKLAQFKFKS